MTSRQFHLLFDCILASFPAAVVTRTVRRDIALLYACIRLGLTHQCGAVTVLFFAELEQWYQRADTRAQGRRVPLPCPCQDAPTVF